MANTSKPNGLIPVGTLSGAPVSGTIRSYLADGVSDIFVGDLVAMTSAGKVGVAGAGTTGLVGVCVGFQNAQAGQNNGVTDHFMSGASDIDRQKMYYDASVDGEMWILVAEGVDTLFEIQCTNTIGLTAVGNNADIVTTTSGSTSTGRSGQELSATTGTTPAQLRIVAPVNRIDNDVSSANSRWIVKINESHYNNTTGV